MDKSKGLLFGSWLDAIGTDLVVYGEVRELIGVNDINNKIIAVGEALEALGAFFMGSSLQNDPLNFKGNVLDGVGEAIAAVGNYKQYLDPENGEVSVSYEIFGDTLQMIGSGLMAKAEFKNNQPIQTLANTLQSYGAGLEALGAYLTLNDEETTGLWIVVQGAVIQSLGSNLTALITTKEYFEKRVTTQKTSTK